MIGLRKPIVGTAGADFNGACHSVRVRETLSEKWVKCIFSTICTSSSGFRNVKRDDSNEMQLSPLNPLGTLEVNGYRQSARRMSTGRM